MLSRRVPPSLSTSYLGVIITEWIPLRPPLDTARCEIFPHSGGISQLQAVEPDSTTLFSPHFNQYACTVGASRRIASAFAYTSIARAFRHMQEEKAKCYSR